VIRASGPARSASPPPARFSRASTFRICRAGLFIQYAGATNNAGASGDSGYLAEVPFFTTFDWTYNDVDLTVTNTYVSSTVDTA